MPLPDAIDLRLADRELAAGTAALHAAQGIRDRRARGEAIKAALSKLMLAARLIGTVVERRTAVPKGKRP